MYPWFPWKRQDVSMVFFKKRQDASMVSLKELHCIHGFLEKDRMYPWIPECLLGFLEKDRIYPKFPWNRQDVSMVSLKARKRMDFCRNRFLIPISQQRLILWAILFIDLCFWSICQGLCPYICIVSICICIFPYIYTVDREDDLNKVCNITLTWGQFKCSML